MAKIACISDLHGKLPTIEESDILIISGDICPDKPPYSDTYVGSLTAMLYQSDWLKTIFKEWLDKQPVKEVVAVFGNHDFIGDRRPDLVPKLKWHLLENETKEILGLKIFGSPYQPFFYDWAYNAPEGKEGEIFLDNIFSKIEDNTDIVICHGPPFSHGDLTVRGENVGSKALLTHIDRVKPKLVVCGHIHSGYGKYNIGETTIFNASVLDEKYKLVNKPIYFEI
jgi:Icc-related predicted phosphoesterase